MKVSVGLLDGCTSNFMRAKMGSSYPDDFTENDVWQLAVRDGELYGLIAAHSGSGTCRGREKKSDPIQRPLCIEGVTGFPTRDKES